MKLKTVTIEGKTYAEVQDDKPVYVHDDGKEVAFDAPGTAATISRLNGEAKGHREAKEAAEAALKAFEGLDAAAAKEAISKLATIDQKKLIDAGEVERVKAEISKGFQTQIDELNSKLKTADTTIYDLQVGGAFKGSKFLAEKVAVPAHLLQNTFGKNFKVEDGKVVPYDASGNKIFSRSRPGEVADFDEGLELMIAADPYKDHILKGNVGTGGGAGQGKGGDGGGKSLTRAAFEAMDQSGRDAAIASGATITD